MADQTVRIDFLARYSSNLGALQRDLRNMGNAASQGAGKASAGLHSLGRFSKIAGTALLVGVGAALAVGAKAAIDFESSFAGVRKTVEGSEAEFMRLAGVIKDMSTEIPVSVHELNRIAELGGQLGVPIEALEDFTEVIAKLGATTNLEIDDAATGFARISNVMGTSLDDFDNMGAAIVDLGNNFATTEEEILNFSLRLSGIGSTVGLTEQEVLGLATAFTSLGEPAERGATALQRTFVAFQSIADTGGSKLDDLAAVMGMTRDAAAELIKADPAEAFLAFEEGLGKIIEEGGDATGTLKGLGLGAVRTTTLLLKGAAGLDTLTEAIDTSNDAWEENVALDEEAEKRFETVASQMSLVANQAIRFGIALGDMVLPVIKDVITFMGGFIGVLEDNMGLLKILGGGVLILGVVRGLKFLTGHLTSAATGLLGFRAAMSQALIMTGSWKKAMQAGVVATGGLGSILGIAAIAFGAYATAMAHSRAKVKALRDGISELNEIIRESGRGAESKDSLFETMLANLDLTDTQLTETLNHADLSFQEFSTLLLGNSEDWDAWASATLQAINGFSDEASALGGTEMANVLQPSEMDGRTAALERLLNFGKSFRLENERLLEIEQEASRLAFRNAGLETLHPFEQRTITDFIDISIDDILPSELQFYERLGDLIGDEDPQEFMDEILEDVAELGDAFEDAWTDIVQGHADTFNDWRNNWEDYENVAALSVSKLKTSLENWAEDSDRLLAAQLHVTENFGFEQEAVWASLPEGMRRGLAALLHESGSGKFEEALEQIFGAEVTANIDTFMASVMDAPRMAFGFMESQWPTMLQQALSGLPDEMEGSMEDMIEAGRLAWELGFGVLSPEMKAAIIQQLEDTLTTFRDNQNIVAPENWLDMTSEEQAQWLRDAGVDIATLIAAGFESVDLEWIFATKLSAAAAAAKRAAEGHLEMRSPSRVFMRIGEGVGEGFKIGLADSMAANTSDMFSNFVSGAQNNLSRDQAINVDVSGMPKTGDTHIEVHGQTKDLNESARLAGSYLGVLRRIEGKVGNR